MKLLRRIITIVCLVATFTANAGEQLTTKAKCVVNQPTNAELRLLQGTWEGVLVGDQAQQRITVTITGNSLHFHRDTNFWWKTTFTLPAGTDPKQLHATIKDCHDCPPQQENSGGTVVVAIFKIEDGTLTLATGNGDGEAPKSFEAAPNRYELRKVQLQKKNSRPKADETENHELASLPALDTVLPMALTNLAVAEEALSLSPAERADLARLLIESLSGDSRTDEQIREDLEQRLAALVSGKDSGLTFEEVFGHPL